MFDRVTVQAVQGAGKRPGRADGGARRAQAVSAVGSGSGGRGGCRLRPGGDRGLVPGRLGAHRQLRRSGCAACRRRPAGRRSGGRSSRASCHWSAGRTFTVSRSTTRSRPICSTPSSCGSSSTASSQAGSAASSSAAAFIAAPTAVEVRAVRDRQVDDDLGEALAAVADAEHLAVADVPDGPVDVPQPAHPQPDRLDRAGGLAEVDDVPDAVLVLEDHEDPGQEVLDQVLRAEAERDADDPGARDEGPELEADLAEHEHHREHADHQRGDAAQQRADGLRALPAPLGDQPGVSSARCRGVPSAA